MLSSLKWRSILTKINPTGFSKRLDDLICSRNFVSCVRPVKLGYRYSYNPAINMGNRNVSYDSHATNKLIEAKSPYLLQHARNPVNWYPWGEEAFSIAREQDKLIFLSVGYSTCHWCHVMEKECFENEEIAAYMNEHYVNIKVDREERPDVDKVYMTFLQLTTRNSAGWPMSIVLTPQNLEPIFGGTYIPPYDRYGIMGFKTRLERLQRQWQTDKSSLIQIGTEVSEILRKVSSPIQLEMQSSSLLENSCVKNGVSQILDHFDPQWGGFYGAPKFPQPSILFFLLHTYARFPNDNKLALDAAVQTLRMMDNGGIHDHVGKGFCRYSTDEKWHVPHFEKMLYDQAQLIEVYCWAYSITKEERFARVAKDILEYVSRDLAHKDGGIFSAEDADSLPNENAVDKKEGAFYVWTYEEVRQVLEPKLADLFCNRYNIKPAGNVDPSKDPHGELLNQNVPIILTDGPLTAENEALLEEAKKLLYQRRIETRPRPLLDTKIITAWNGLALSAFCKAFQALQDVAYKDAAIRLAEFIKSNLAHSSDGSRLYHCVYAEDRNSSISQVDVPIAGMCSDYAFMIRGLTDLYECTLDSEWLSWAQHLQESQDKLFWDESGSRYFMTPSDIPTLLIRMKDDHDGAEPSANSISAHNLLKLGTVFDEREDYRIRADKVLSSFSYELSENPTSVAITLSALIIQRETHVVVYICGDINSEETKNLVTVVQSYLSPCKCLVFVDGDSDSSLYKQSDAVRNTKANAKPSAHVCTRRTCAMPVNTPEQLTNQLKLHYPGFQ